MFGGLQPTVGSLPITVGDDGTVLGDSVSEVVHLASRAEFGLRRARTRVDNMTTMFQALEAGGLLDVAPEDPAAQANHTVARKLLTLVQAELDMLRQELP